MAKKQKRRVSNVSNSAVSAPSASPARVSNGSLGASASASAGSGRVSRMPSTVEEFNPDYSYVMADLKHIGILAVSFISILVVLSFIIH